MASTVHQLKVTLLGTKPPIWRRVVVPSDITLAHLHDVVQAAMGWWDCHLHEFEIGGERYGVPDGEDWDPPKNERGARLSALVAEGASFLYVYDFGDHWQHRITVEKVLHEATGVKYPICTGGRRACPPEDCGGAWGFADFATAISDPAHEDHEAMLEWVGGSFDPAAFDPSESEHRLRLRRLVAL